MKPVPIASGFYRSESLPLSAQRCVNWIPVVPEASAYAQRALIDVPGLSAYPTIGETITGANRGSQVMSDVPYYVNGQTLYSIDKDGVVSRHGSIQGASRVVMANNGRYLVIVVPGTAAYAYDNVNESLSQINSPNFRTPDSVVYKDGYFVFTTKDIFFNSALNDPFTYDALDFGTAEISPDFIVAAHVNHNELFIGGRETIELFQNVGGAGFPFQRIPGANIQKGLHSKYGTVEFDNTFLFIGGGYNEKTAIWKVSSSSSAGKVSHAAIDDEIQKFTEAEISNAFAMSFAFGGNFFAAFTFESDRIPSKTFVYDATTSQLTGAAEWHERQTGVTEDRWCVTSVLRAFGELLVGDCRDGRIGKMDKSVHTEYGDVIYRERASQPFFGETDVFAGQLQLTMESGVGGVNDPDPQIRMDYSDDGGRTFTSEFWRSYGKRGNYDIIPTWRRLGRIPKARVIRFKTTANAPSNLLKLEAEAEGAVQ